MAGRFGRVGRRGGGRQGRGGGRGNGHIDEVLNRMATVLENMAGGQVGGLGVLAEFKKADPPKFEGGHNPEGAARWLQEIEKILEAMECQDAQKVKCAVFMLIGEAENWWKHTKQLLLAAHRDITWVVFKGKFLGKYFPADVRRQKEIEFLALKQGSMSVDEYATKFEELLEFSNYYQNNEDTRALCMRFEDGLRPEIRLAFCNQDIDDLTTLMTKCRNYENVMKAKENEEERVRTTDQGSDAALGGFGPVRDENKGHHHRVEPYQKVQGREEVKAEPERFNAPDNAASQCYRCGRFHEGPCRMGRTCYNCHQPGHVAAHCPSVRVPRKEEANTIRVRRNTGKQPMRRTEAYTRDGK